MSQDSEEKIKTTEQWRWSEMQGLELVSSSSSSSISDPHKPNPQIPTLEVERGESKEEMEEASVPNKGGVGVSSNSGGGGSSSSGEKHESVPSSGFGELFRFADGLDYILMSIGTVGAIVHGCSLPLFLRFFADLVNSFGSNANDLDKMTQEVVKVTNSEYIPKLEAFL